MELVNLEVRTPYELRAGQLKSAIMTIASAAIALRQDASDLHWHNWEWTYPDKEDTSSECLLCRLGEHHATETFFTIVITGGINLYRKLEAEANTPVDWQEVDDELAVMQKLMRTRADNDNVREQMLTRLEYLFRMFQKPLRL